MNMVLSVFHKMHNDLIALRAKLTKHHEAVDVEMKSLQEEKEKLINHANVLDSKIAKIGEIVA